MEELDKLKLAEMQLCEIFNLQIPPSTSTAIKQRCFTIAARDNAEKVLAEPEIAKLLDLVGAYAPVRAGENYKCFGILWERNHRCCVACGMQMTCMAAAKNLGLDTIKISPRLLGTKLARTPMILSTVEPASEVAARVLEVKPRTESDEEILNYLNEHLRAVYRENEIYYQVPEVKNVYPFCVGTPERLMELRFCNPSPVLKKNLKQTSKGKGLPSWIVADGTPLEQVLSLINEHISNVLTDASTSQLNKKL